MITFTETDPLSAIYSYTGTPCSGSSCTGWTELDNNPSTGRIEACSAGLFESHKSVQGPSNSSAAEAIGISCFECR